MSYFILFPISFRFLATYQVDASIANTITLDSYITTFTTLSFVMGIVFQFPLFAYILGKMGFIDAPLLRRYRKYAFVIIMILAAIITPPDLFTLILGVSGEEIHSDYFSAESDATAGPKYFFSLTRAALPILLRR